MTTRPAPGAATEDPTIGRLVADASRDLSALLRDEIALAKTEVTVDVKKAGKGGAMFAVAAVCALLGVIFLLHTIAQGLIELDLAPWLAYLIVTLLLFAGAGITAMMGKGAFSRIKGKPERTIRSAKETIEAVKPGSGN